MWRPDALASQPRVPLEGFPRVRGGLEAFGGLLYPANNSLVFDLLELFAYTGIVAERPHWWSRLGQTFESLFMGQGVPGFVITLGFLEQG